MYNFSIKVENSVGSSEPEMESGTSNQIGKISCRRKAILTIPTIFVSNIHNDWVRNLIEFPSKNIILGPADLAKYSILHQGFIFYEFVHTVFLTFLNLSSFKPKFLPNLFILAEYFVCLLILTI